MTAKPARYYNAANNPGGHQFFSGVPLGNIDQETWDSLPEHLQNSIDAHDMYRKTPVPRPKQEEEKDDGRDSGDEQGEEESSEAEAGAEAETESDKSSEEGE